MGAVARIKWLVKLAGANQNRREEKAVFWVAKDRLLDVVDDPCDMGSWVRMALNPGGHGVRPSFKLT